MASPTAAWVALRTAMVDTEPACRGDDRFIQEDSALSDLAPICHGCPLLGPCRDLAMTGNSVPVWGIVGGVVRRGSSPTGLMNPQALGRLING